MIDQQTRRVFKWRLSMLLRLDRVNDTGKPQMVKGQAVPPGARVVWAGDDAPPGY